MGTAIALFWALRSDHPGSTNLPLCLKEVDRSNVDLLGSCSRAARLLMVLHWAEDFASLPNVAHKTT